MTTLANTVREHIQAGFSGIWITTEEPDATVSQLANMAKEQDWTLTTWDADAGIPGLGGTEDPVTALHALPAIASQTGKRAIVLYRHLHRHTADTVVLAAILNALARGREMGAHVVALAPTSELPPEIARHFAVVHQTLPSADDLLNIARLLTNGDATALPDDQQPLAEAAAGLTSAEAENAFSLSLVRHNRIRTDEVWDLKTQALEKSATLRLHQGNERFAQLAGLQAIKEFATRALRPNNTTIARGMLLLGVPGTGKSAFAKALGNQTGRPCLTLDLSALFGSLVGQTEGQMRRALETADAMSPAILFIDEIEKGLAGSRGGENDGGTAQRMFGHFLTWLSDHRSEVFVVATANDISSLPGALTRAGRFDAIFMIDAPDAAARAAIWWLYRNKFGIPADQQSPQDCEDWTGSEVESCCRLANLLGSTLTDAAKLIVPVTTTYAEDISRLRRWAHNRAIDAATGTIYQEPGKAFAPTAATGEPSRRRVERH
jgi:hypothetical protein